MSKTVKNPPTVRFLAFCLVAFVGVATFPSLSRAATPEEENVAIAARAAKIAETLSEGRSTVGLPSDRVGWARLAAAPNFKEIKTRADSFLTAPIPELPASLYLEYFDNGNRSRYQNAYSLVYSRLATLAIAEAVENKGRYIPALEDVVRFLCAQPSWILPAHDTKAVVFNKEVDYSDLVSTLVGAQMAVVGRWFEDKLSPEVCELIAENLEKRVLKPYEREAKTREISKKWSGMWWVRGTNNWNAVCSAGTLATALYAVESKERRAWFVAATEYFSEKYFLPNGFTADGYCTEGLSYWNYGFGYYVYLSALATAATDGEVDLLRFPIVRKISEYAPNAEISRGQYLAFADCPTNARPSALYVGYLSRALGLGRLEYEKAGLNENFRLGNLLEIAALGFDERVVFARAAETTKNASAAPLRTEFPSAGVLICRPTAKVEGDFFAVAMKGGNNGEHHNHNDVGSYSLMKSSFADGAAVRWISQDPGGETYTRRTFSGDRYKGELLNSFGHPTPRIAGTLQSTGGKARGVQTELETTDATDRLRLDLTSAYAVPGLKRAERLFVFHRAQEGIAPTFKIEDSVEFTPQKGADFETALVTFEKFAAVSEESDAEDGKIVLSIADVRITATAVDATGAALPLVLDTTIVGENDDSVPKKPTRVAFKIARPVENATITTLFELEK